MFFKRIKILIVFIVCFMSVNSQIIKNAIIQIGKSYNYDMITSEVSIITKNNLYLGFDYHIGANKLEHWSHKPEYNYNYYSNSKNLFLGYSFNKFYLSSILGHFYGIKIYDFTNKSEVSLLNIGGEIGWYFNNIVISTSYSNLNKLTLKIGIKI